MRPRAPAAHRRRGKRPIDRAHRTDSPTPHRRLGHILAVRSFSLRFSLATAPQRPRKHRLQSPPPLPPLPVPDAPCPRRPRRRNVVVLRPFFLRYVLAAGSSAPCLRWKSSVLDMGGILSRMRSMRRRRTNDDGLKECTRQFDWLQEFGDLSANTVQVDEHNDARSGVGYASDITMEEAPSCMPEEDLPELFTPLTYEEESEVNSFLSGSGHSINILVHERSSIVITREKLGCLRPRGWLNDEVINLYLELLKERAEREPNRFLKCHFFNTFFYKKLAGGKTGYDYQSVRRWTTLNKLGYELVQCDKIFIPIHRDLHWSLAVINMKERTFQYLDSLGGMDYEVLNILARYIMDELNDKSNTEIDFNSWLEVPVHPPLQYNGWDCGMFMLKFIDFYSRGLGLSFGQVLEFLRAWEIQSKPANGADANSSSNGEPQHADEHMEYFRKRTAKEILRLKAE